MSRCGIRSTLQALAAIALWATLAFLGVRLKALPPFLLVGLALLVGALPALPFIRRWTWRPGLVLLGAYGLFGFHLLLFLALRRAPAIEANLVNYLWPLLIVLLTPLFFRGERLTALHIGGALAGFAGAALLVTGGRWGFAAEHAAGYAMAAGSACIWATYSLMTRKAAPFSSETVGLFCLVSGLLSLAAHALLEPAYAPTAGEWGTLLILGLGPMGAAFFLWDGAMKTGDPRRIGTLAYLTPLGSTLLLAATGSGQLTALAGVAMVLIVGGAVLPNLAGRRRG